MANLAVARPLGKDHFADQLRFHPMRVAAQRSGGRRGERTCLLLDPVEPRAQIDGEFVRESGADLAAEHEVTTLVVPDEQRSKSCPCPLRIGEPTDDEFLALDEFGLEPPAVTSRAVWLVAPLRHDAFESCAACLREKRFAVSLDVLGEADAPRGMSADKLLEPRLPFFEGKILQAFAIQTEKIEDEVDERAAVPSASRVLQRL